MATVKVDFNKLLNKIKPLHAVNDVPSAGFRFGDAEEGIGHLAEAGIPYSRLHDLSGRYGSNVFVDISNIFRNFDADENDPNNYDFIFTDKLLEMLVKFDVKPFYRLGETIENDSAIKRYRTNPPKDNLKWARICEHIILHYNYGWANGYKFGLEYWEIWNEPDNASNEELNQMWGGTPEQFYSLYSDAAIYLKSKFPEIKIGGYGSVGFYSIAQKELDPTANAEAGAAWFYVDYFDNFLEYIKKTGAPLDFFSWHSYSTAIQNKIYADYVRKTLDKNGYVKTESHCNEWNPGTSDRCTIHDAVNVASSMLMWQDAPIDMAMYYNSRVTSSYGGLFDPLTWDPTKTYYVFKAFNELYKLKNQVDVKCDDEKIYVVGASDGNEVALMMSNFSGENRPLTLEGFENIKNKQLFVIDSYRTLTLTSFAEIESGTLKKESVVLIKGNK